MYDPKFSVKQMYDQYGSSRTKKVDPKPSRSSGFGGMGPDPAERFGGSPTRGLGSKPDYSSSAYDSGGADNNPNRDAAESMGVVKKVLDRAVTRFRKYGASEPEDVIVDGKRVYKGPLFRGFDPTARIGEFGGESGKKQYLLGMPILGEVTRSPAPPTLPPADTNPTLNMFGVTRGFARNPDPLLPPDPMVQPKTGIDTYAEMKQSIDKTLEGVVSVDYTIKRGDTLSEIAQDRGTTVDVLLKMNDIKEEDKDTIFAGEKLKVPPKKAKTYKDVVDDLYASSDQIMSDAYDPQRQYYQSQVPMDQRIFEPEIGEGMDNVVGYDDVPQTVRGLMSKTNIVKEDFDTSDVKSDSVSYESVKKVQKRLNDLGYTTLIGDLKVDGKLGRGTARQLRKFQATAGLRPTATAGQPVDAATMKALKDNKFNNKEGKDSTATVTPLQDGLFEIIKAPIAYLESRGHANPYAISGGAGKAYDGKYQLGKVAKDTIKNKKVKDADGNMVDVFTAAEKVKLNHPSNRADFRADSELQEKAFRQLTESNHAELTKNSAKYRAMDQANQLAVLGYAHNQGAEAALEWLTTAVVGTDAFGTRGDKYSEAITEIFTKDDMLG